MHQTVFTSESAEKERKTFRLATLPTPLLGASAFSDFIEPPPLPRSAAASFTPQPHCTATPPVKSPLGSSSSNRHDKSIFSARGGQKAPAENSDRHRSSRHINHKSNKRRPVGPPPRVAVPKGRPQTSRDIPSDSSCEALPNSRAASPSKYHTALYSEQQQPHQAKLTAANPVPSTPLLPRKSPVTEAPASSSSAALTPLQTVGVEHSSLINTSTAAARRHHQSIPLHSNNIPPPVSSSPSRSQPPTDRGSSNHHATPQSSTQFPSSMETSNTSGGSLSTPFVNRAAAAAPPVSPAGSPVLPSPSAVVQTSPSNSHRYHQVPSNPPAPLATRAAAPRNDQRPSAAPSQRPHFSQPPKRFSGIGFLIVVVHIIAFEYLCYTILILGPMLVPRPSPTGVSVAILFHILFGLTLWSFVQCVVTDPGAVPPNWGFYMGDKNKRRRYCQVCNIWKPDRTHHCSACSQCVLNMDHHCPWIYNCVGFFNRKFFIQLLCYALMSCIFVTIHGLSYVLQRGFLVWPYGKINATTEFEYAMDVVAYIFVCIMLLIAAALAFPLIPFLRFHLSLIISNSTTIENMMEGRQTAKYDLGTRRNIEQVMGNCVCLWWLPLHTRKTRPVGDGVRWRQFYLSAIDDEA